MTQSKLTSILLVLLLIGTGSFARAFRTSESAIVVPARMDYCGMHLKFTKKGRARIQNYVDTYTGKYTYYQIMAKRAATYMPFIADAFTVMGVPKDLMYIAIQESALRGGAVSPSNAVGFWQFKDFTAREVGLTVSRDIDERKHIFRASIGAAKYFKMNYKRYDNWVYAVISYMTGGTGAKPYTDEKYIGAQEMVIDEKLHWYAAKAIAHRIAYAPAIAEIERPATRLYPMSNKGEVNVKKLAKQHGVRYEDFKKHNLWILKSELPKDEPFSYYIEAPAKDNPMALLDPHRELYAPEADVPEYLIMKQKEHAKDQRKLAAAQANVEAHRKKGEALHKPVQPPPSRRYTLPPDLTNVRQHPIIKDPYYGVEFVRVERGNTLYSLAKKYDMSVNQLQRWNHLGPRDPLPEGFILSLVPPRKAHVHIARKWETITDVALRYGRNPRRLVRRNRLDDDAELLAEGQRILLQDKKDKDAPTVVYQYAPNNKQFASTAKTKAKAEDNVADSSDGDAQNAITFPPQNPESQVNKPAESSKESSKEPVAESSEDSSSKPAAVAGADSAGPERAASDTATETATTQPAIAGRDTPIEGAKYHYVQPGETLWRIALKHKVPVDTIKDLNTLEGDNIKAGQRIRVQ